MKSSRNRAFLDSSLPACYSRSVRVRQASKASEWTPLTVRAVLNAHDQMRALIYNVRRFRQLYITGPSAYNLCVPPCGLSSLSPPLLSTFAAPLTSPACVARPLRTVRILLPARRSSSLRGGSPLDTSTGNVPPTISMIQSPNSTIRGLRSGIRARGCGSM